MLSLRVHGKGKSGYLGTPTGVGTKVIKTTELGMEVKTKLELRGTPTGVEVVKKKKKGKRVVLLKL